MNTTGRQTFNVFFVPAEPRCIAPWVPTSAASIQQQTIQNSPAERSSQYKLVLTQGNPRKRPTSKSRDKTKGGQQSICEDGQSTDRRQSAMPTTKTKQTNISVRSDTIHHHEDKRQSNHGDQRNTLDQENITFFKCYKSASNRHQHPKTRPSTTGKVISPSTTSEEGDQSGSDTIPYQSDRPTIT